MSPEGVDRGAGRASGRKWTIIVAVVVVLAAVGAGWWLLAGKTVAVPDVAGLSQTDATQALGDAGLKLGEVTEVDDPKSPAGTVLDQDPAAGTRVDGGSIVDLTVAKGREQAEVPDVTGMERAEAESKLAAAGFVPLAVDQYDLQAPSGLVMAQLPSAGAYAYPQSAVGILVSKGSPNIEVTVPDVAGMTESEATAALAKLSLQAVAVSANDPEVPKGAVVRQEPASGTTVPALSQVVILVSGGPGTVTVTVPDVVGERQDAATSSLQAAGLGSETAGVYSSSAEKDVVMGQIPAGGTKVKAGTAIGLLVSLGPPPDTGSPAPSPPPGGGVAPPTEPSVPLVEVPDVAGLDSASAVEALEKHGLEPVPIEVPSEEADADTVVAQLPEAGQIVPVTYPVLVLVSTGPPGAVQLPSEQ